MLAICLLAVVGIGLYSQRVARNPQSLSGPQKMALLLLIGAILVVVAQLGYYNLSYVQAQGRYLFPAVVPFAVIFAVGLKEVVAARYAPVVFGLLGSALILLDLWALYKYLPYLSQ